MVILPSRSGENNLFFLPCDSLGVTGFGCTKQHGGFAHVLLTILELEINQSAQIGTQCEMQPPQFKIKQHTAKFLGLKERRSTLQPSNSEPKDQEKRQMFLQQPQILFGEGNQWNWHLHCFDSASHGLAENFSRRIPALVCILNFHSPR